MDTQTKILTLPAIPIRDMVLFPGARVPFMVGRRASVRTLELGLKVGDHLVLLTQRNPKEESPKQESLHALGTLALVESLIMLPRDHYKVGVKGIARVRLERYLDEGDVVQAEVEILAEPEAPGEAALQEPFAAAVEAFLGRNPEVARMLTLDPAMPLGEAIDAVAAVLPAEVREKQAVLDQLEIEPRLHTLLKLLEADAARHLAEPFDSGPNLERDHKAFVMGEKLRGLVPEGKKDELAQLRERILKATMGDEAEAKALKTAGKMVIVPKRAWLKAGGSIALVDEDRKPTIYLNMANVKASGLHLSDAIIQMAKKPN